MWAVARGYTDNPLLFKSSRDPMDFLISMGFISGRPSPEALRELRDYLRKGRSWATEGGGGT
jgi:hypothetical protein